MALDTVFDIQSRCNDGAASLGRPQIDILNGDEEARIAILSRRDVAARVGRY